MKNQNVQNAAVNQKGMINMKKSNRSFESIMAAVKKQQGQLDAARKAWVAAKTPAAKKLAQKAGESAKKNLETLRQQWKAAKTANNANPVVQESTENQLKAKYHNLKVRGEQELLEAYNEELTALKEKYALKKKELHESLMECYKKELEQEKQAEAPVPAAEAVAPAKMTVPEAVAKNEEEVSAPMEEAPMMTEKADAKKEKTADETEEELIYEADDKRLNSIAAEALCGKAEEDGELLVPGDFFEYFGKKYEVKKIFDYNLFTCVNDVKKQEMLAKAKNDGSIIMAA